MVCGGCLEEQVSVVAQYLLVTGFDVVLIRDLVRVIRPVHASIHDHRLVQAGVVMTTLEQLVYEWMVNETEADTQAMLARFYKGVR
jgi:hypothetical protein